MVYKLKPVFMDKIWGGDYFNKNLNFETSNSCGEAWGISGIEKAPSIVVDETGNETNLYNLYKSNKSLFGDHPSDEFPILVKLIDSNKDLSIQIHPGDEYAKKHHNSYGKTECWYVVDAVEGADIIVGHNAKSKEEVVEKIKTDDYDTLLNKMPVKKGDMFDIYAGTVHAICNGTVILEVQQASDVTYRFYDYGRLENGKPRELHVEHALNVIDVPSKEIKNTGVTPYFSFLIQDVTDQARMAHKYGDYYFILDGEGSIGELPVSKGEFIFLPSETEYSIKGNMKVGFINIK